MKNEPNSDLYCLDMMGHEFDVQGDWTAGAYSMLEVSVVPCMMKLTMIGYADD